MVGVNHGLDKCAELLTNILEIKSEERGKKQPICSYAITVNFAINSLSTIPFPIHKKIYGV